ncbi:hypothetical protein F5B20DRAFT_586572 [Whalleya microplaca]|nr:hypothetical protein F5B20DRAFT_586572 [Whalleya microplaca]
MPFPYRYICDLLQQLDDETHREVPRQIPATTVLENWFREHRSHLNAPENDACAILSTLLPGKRTDRVYGIQAPKLQSVIGKALCLGASRVQELRRYTISGLNLDLADCIESTLKCTPNPPQGANELTVEEIDDALSRIAAACRFSSPAVRNMCTPQHVEQNNSLANFYRRLSARDAKWFTRLVLKNYQPVVMSEHVVFRCYHPLLPQLMRVRDDLTLATAFMRQIIQSPNDQSVIASLLKPSLGTKVGRQPWLKGRSIKHCLDMAGSRQMSCERKIDGEYCQIHVDLCKHEPCIQIFSKSGKDSTKDRLGLHRPIKDSLELGSSKCPLRLGCILEGELVVYSMKDNKILPFHKIRKHVSRSGSFMGTFYDSQPHDYEHLMIVYHDVLMIDNESLLNVPQSERFRRLTKLITCRKGYAELVPREVISFSQSSAASKLREAFAKCIVSREEGLVLKPDEPYFDFSATRRPYSCCNIKLKKEYVQGWGDVGDFSAVGGYYDAAKAKELKLRDLRWTHFFIGCLENKTQARDGTEPPRFRVINIIELPEHLLLTVKTQCGPGAIPFEENESRRIALDFGGREAGPLPTEVFLNPLVFDMRCFSFDKEPNTNFWSMRFPMVSKIHHDRSYLDTITFAELQEIAQTTTEMPAVEDSQEMCRWVSALEKADPGGIAVDAISQRSTSTDSTFSYRGYADQDSQRISVPEAIQEENNSNEWPPMPPPDTVVPLCRPTISRSSAPDNMEPCALSEVSGRPSTNPERPKRPLVDTPASRSTSKRQRRLSNASSVPSTSTDRSSGLSANSVRTPLGQINANRICEQHGAASLPQISTKHMHQPSMLENSPIPTENNRSPPLPASSPCSTSRIVSPSRRRPSTAQDTLCNHNQHALRECCLHLGPKCAFANCSILLSPCISQYAWVTDSLLREHGIDDFITDPDSWSRVSSSNVSADISSSRGPLTNDMSRRSTRRPRIRKICLVESRRAAATAAIIRKIEEASLTKRNGKREWIAVYDWRVLETITDQESRKIKPGGDDPWRKWYVGIA